MTKAPKRLPGFWMMITIILVCIGIEVTLSLSDAGLIASSRLRRIIYEYGGFWPGLLGDWTPNYFAQPWVMFLTYGFLHGGLAHLVVNMITLWSLGLVVLDRVGGRGFLMLYTASTLGGGIGYALLAPGLTPMVGASGALFGLAGGILAWSYVDRFTFRERLWPVARAFLLLLLLNVVLWWAMKGHLAWETHLGGFVAGWVAALLIDPRAVKDEDRHSVE